MGKNYHLNSIVNRFGFNKKKNVGDLLELIFAADPLTLEEWEQYYYKNGKAKTHLEKIGRDIFEKIGSVIIPELTSIQEEDCKEYIRNLVVKSTFEGMKTRYEKLNRILFKECGIEFSYLPDHKEDWRFKTFKIDYYYLDISKDLLIGIKVAPNTLRMSQNPVVITAREEIENIHRDAQDKKAGHFFILYYEGVKTRGLKIANPEVVEQIKELLS